MDKLQVIKKCEERGGADRRSAIEAMIRTAHRLGCDVQVGGGRAGGINVRYGSIGYAVMDVNTKGQVKVYVQPHPGKDAPKDLWESLNGLIKEIESFETKQFPVGTYSYLESKLEDLPTPEVERFLEESVTHIRETYYSGQPIVL